MKIEFKNKKIAVLIFCAAAGLMFFGCQTSSYLEEPISQKEFYDYGARYYEPMLGVISLADPVAERYANVCPYAYVLDKPIYIDLKGDSILKEKVSLLRKKSEVKE